MPALATVAALPKAELHLHFEGAIRPSTARELADRHGLPVPTSGSFADLTEFVVAYEAARDLVRSLDDLRRIARELVEDAARRGVVWTEVHLVPPTYGGRLGPAEGILEAVIDGLQAGSSTHSAAAVIVGINRGLPMDAAQESLRLALAYAGRGVVGLGLAGDEAHHPAPAFAALFASAKQAGLRCVPHGGEGAGAESVRACVEDLRADRVCHGVRAVEDPALLELLAKRNVCLDVAPTSNVALGVRPAWPRHALPELLTSGVPVSLNSDCPLFFGASINDEYERAMSELGFGRDVLATVAESSLMFSSCPTELLQPALRRVRAWRTACPRHGQMSV